MKAGESQRYDCTDCVFEVEVTYEPKARDNPKAAKGMPESGGPAKFCPFCGTEIEDGGDGEDD